MEGPFLGPYSGPKTGPAGECYFEYLLPQAFVSWQLHNYHASQATGRVIRLNLDETRVLYYVRSGVGNVAMRRSGAASRGRMPRQNVSKAAQRAAMTHIGLISDWPSLQGRLPQVFLANDRLVLQRDLSLLTANLPPFVHLIRGRSSWNNVDRMVWLIGLLGRCLQLHAPGALPILSMDACRLHLHPRVLRACEDWGIRVVVIPPRLTWLLQPLDTHVFALMKKVMRDAYQARLGRAGGRVLSTAEWVDVVTHSIYCFLQSRSWVDAFRHNGYGPSQDLVSRRVLSALKLDAPPTIAATEPAVEQLRSLWPRRARLDGPRLLIQTRRAPRILSHACVPCTTGCASGCSFGLA